MSIKTSHPEVAAAPAATAIEVVHQLNDNTQSAAETQYLPELTEISKSVRTLSRCNATAGDILLKTYTADPADFDGDAEIERMMEIHEQRLVEAASDPTLVLLGKGPDCLVGFDTEYWTDPATGIKDTLSLQLHLMAEGGQLARIYYPPPGERPSLIQCLVRLLTEAGRLNIVRE